MPWKRPASATDKPAWGPCCVTNTDIDTSSKVFVYHAATMADAADGAVEHMTRSLSAHPLLVPSTLDQGDSLVGAVQRGFRARSVASSVVVPERSIRLGTGVLSRQRPVWKGAHLALPDKPYHEVLLPARLLEADAVIFVTYVNAVARTGPFQLDLLSRYLRPRHRLRQLVDPDRAGLAAEVNLALQPGWCIVGCDVPPGIVAITRDRIAGELIALCLAERFFDRRVEFASPWEDRVVQRATELELGARTPGEIWIDIMGEAMDTREGDAVRAIVALVRERIGIVSGESTGVADDSRPA